MLPSAVPPVANPLLLPGMQSRPQGMLKVQPASCPAAVHQHCISDTISWAPSHQDGKLPPSPRYAIPAHLEYKLWLCRTLEYQRPTLLRLRSIAIACMAPLALQACIACSPEINSQALHDTKIAQTLPMINKTSTGQRAGSRGGPSPP